MRLLLDTHTLLWWLDGDRRLSRRARHAIADPDNAVVVSAASAWEIATKVRIGKLPGAIDVAADIPGCLTQQQFQSALESTELIRTPALEFSQERPVCCTTTQRSVLPAPRGS